MVTEDLVAFLRARLDEDDRRARQANPDPSSVKAAINHSVACYSGDILFAATFTPARVLADVEARRRMIDRVVHDIEVGIRYGDEHYTACSCGWEQILGSTGHADIHYDRHLGDVGFDEAVSADLLRLLALAYAAHPDYQEQWKP